MHRFIIFLSLLGFCFAACKYTVKDKKYGLCKGSKTEFTISDVDLILDDECTVLLSGCVTMKKAFKKIEVKYKAYRNNMTTPLLVGSHNACGFKYNGKEIVCPTKPSDNYCMKLVKYPIPQTALEMAVGKARAQADIITDFGTFCYEGSGRLIKNK